MIEERLSNDTAKEFLTILSYCDTSFINSIPENVLNKLKFLAADSTREYYIDKTKKLSEQNISEDCKDLLGIMYFMYMTNANTKDKMLDIWLKNEYNSKIN